MNNYLIPIESKMELFARVYSKDSGVTISLGPRAETDGKNIWVPPIPDQADKFLRLTTEMFVYHETGHVKTNDAPAFHSYTDTTKQFVFNIVRDAVIEHVMETEYPGMAGKWREFLTTYIKQTTNKEMADPNTDVLRKLLLTLYIRCREQHLNADLGLQIPQEIQEVYDAKLAKYVPEIIKTTSVTDSQDLTERIFNDIKEDVPPEEKKPNEQGKGSSGQQDPSGSGAAGSDQSDPSGGGNDQAAGQDGIGSPDGAVPNTSQGSDLQPGSDSSQGGNGSPSGNGERKENGGGNPAGSTPDPNQTPDGKNVGGGTDQDPGNRNGDNGTVKLSKEARKALEQARKEIEAGKTNTEGVFEQVAKDINQWAETNHLYRDVRNLQEDIVHQPKIPGWETEVARHEAKGREMTGYIGRKMKVLFISEKAPTWQHNLRSGKLDPRKLHKLSRGSLDVCKRKGESVYEDSAVYLVIDNSSSMNSKSPIAQGLLTSMASDLDKLRIPFGAVGFTSTSEYAYGDGVRRNPCTLNLMKDFDDPYRRVRHRFVWPSNTKVTAEFPAIRFAAMRLAMRRETKRVLFVLTDGQTCTGDQVLNGAMRKAMAEYFKRLLKAGMKVVGVGIESNSLKDYIPDFIECNNLSTFAVEFYAKLTKLIL
jgi:cobalamin biosynthesis protein CobT